MPNTILFILIQRRNVLFTSLLMLVVSLTGCCIATLDVLSAEVLFVASALSLFKMLADSPRSIKILFTSLMRVNGGQLRRSSFAKNTTSKLCVNSTNSMRLLPRLNASLRISSCPAPATQIQAHLIDPSLSHPRLPPARPPPPPPLRRMPAGLPLNPPLLPLSHQPLLLLTIPLPLLLLPPPPPHPILTTVASVCHHLLLLTPLMLLTTLLQRAVMLVVLFTRPASGALSERVRRTFVPFRIALITFSPLLPLTLSAFSVLAPPLLSSNVHMSSIKIEFTSSVAAFCSSLTRPA